MSTAWRRCVPEDGTDVYFFNLDTGDTLWAPPEGVAHIPEFGVEDEEAAGTHVDTEEAPAPSPAPSPAASPRPVSPPVAAVPAPSAGAGPSSGPSTAPSEPKGWDAMKLELQPWASPVGPMCTLEPQNPVAKLWDVRHTESVGHSEGEVYYVNKSTGETVWEAPEGFTDAEVDTLADLDADVPLTTALHTLALTAPSVMKCAADLRRRGGTDVSLLISKLKSLILLLQSHGSDEEWTAVITAGDLALPKLVYTWWCPTSPPALATLTVRVLAVMGNIAPAVMAALVDGTWAPAGYTIEGIALFASLAVGVGDAPSPSRSPGRGGPAPDEEQLGTWVVFLQAVCFTAATKAKGDLPHPDIVGRLVNSFMESRAEAFNGAAKALASLSALYPDACADAVVQVCAHHALSSSFAQALIHELNEASGSPDSVDPGATHRMLAFTQRLLRFQSNVQAFFYTNDLKVLLDVIIRELHDLSPGDQLRVEYLELLRVLLLHSQWAEMGYYRRDDVLNAIEGVMSALAHSSGLHPGARDAAERILVDCAPLLE